MKAFTLPAGRAPSPGLALALAGEGPFAGRLVLAVGEAGRGRWLETVPAAAGSALGQVCPGGSPPPFPAAPGEDGPGTRGYWSPPGGRRPCAPGCEWVFQGRTVGRARELAPGEDPGPGECWYTVPAWGRAAYRHTSWSPGAGWRHVVAPRAVLDASLRWSQGRGAELADPPAGGPADDRALVLVQDQSGFRGGWRLHAEQQGEGADVDGVIDAARSRERRQRARPDFAGGVCVVCAGWRAQGDAGHAGGGGEYLLIVLPGTTLRVRRAGRLYGALPVRAFTWTGGEWVEEPGGDSPAASRPAWEPL